MKKLFTLLFITLCMSTFAQDSLINFIYSRNHITKTGMEVLGSWSLLNIGIGVTGLAETKGGTNKYFYQMTTIWGAANLGAALLGYTNAQRNKGKQLSPAENLKEQQKTERLFLINGALDVVYIGTGIFLKTRGDNQNSAQLKGYGPSIIIQGVFLLLFDATMYSVQTSNGSKLRRFFEKNPVTYNRKQIGIIINL